MAFEFTWENDDTRLVLTVFGDHGPEDLPGIQKGLVDSLNTNMTQLLVDHSKANIQYDATSGHDFGEQVVMLFAGRNIRIAVVKGDDMADRTGIDSTVFNAGVSLAQFTNQLDAREWLDS